VTDSAGTPLFRALGALADRGGSARGAGALRAQDALARRHHAQGTRADGLQCVAGVAGACLRL